MTNTPPQTPKPDPTALEMLVKIQNQNVEIIKELRSINSKVGFFVFVLALVIILQIVSAVLR